jgi:hypothetical protein
VRTCESLRKKQLQEFTIEDLRIMIGQEISLFFLIPLVIEVLTNDLFAEDDMYEGDLLKNILGVNPGFWNDHKHYWLLLNNLIKDRRQEIEELKFDLSGFYSCNHK